MFISPLTAIEKGWIKFPDWMSEEQKQKCLQPNALDFTIDSLFVLDRDTPFHISEDTRVMRKTYECQTTPDIKHAPEYSYLDDKQWWILQHQHCYDAMSDFYVNVPEGVAAMLVPRSSFNRNGLFIMSGIFDSGFQNNIGFMIYNLGGNSRIAPHTRIGQIIFVDSQTSGKLYDGIYNENKGQHWSHNFNEPKQHQSFTTGNNVGEFTVDPTKSEYL